MSTHPTAVAPAKFRHSASSNTLSSSTPSGFGRWLIEHRIRPLSSGVLREEIEAAVHARTTELEQEISALREEIDRRTTAERDLLQAKKAAEAAYNDKSAFLATFCHELRVPLDGMASMIDLLRKTSLTPEQADLVQAFGRSSDWLLGIANNLLDFSKIEAGRLKLETVEFELAEEVQLAADLHADAATRKGLELIVDIDAAAPTRLRGDPLRLRQILANLIGNAIKFTPRGEIAVRVRLERNLPGRSRLRFDVTDTGIGICAAAQATLFEPFVQAAVAPTRPFDGTGLGLAICKHLVSLMSGEIGVISAMGAGATFWFSIELERPPEPTPESMPPDLLAGRHVLIVDDNATNRKLFGHLAGAWGMRPGMAGSKETALAYLRDAAQADTPVDLVLLDHDMMCTNGLSLAKAIRADASIPQPILTLLSPRGKRLTRLEQELHGIAQHELKPVHPKKLRTMLTRALRMSPPATARVEAKPALVDHGPNPAGRSRPL